MTSSAPSPGKPLRYRWVVLNIFMVGHASGIVGAMVLGVLLPAISDDLRLSPGQQGWLGASAVIGNLVFSVPFGWWLSRYNVNMVAAITFILGTLFVFVQGLAPTFAILLLGRMIFGLTSVAREPLRAILFQHWLPRREIPIFNGLLNGVFGLALTLFFIVIPIVLEAFGGDWRKTLYAFGFYSAALTMAWIIFARSSPGEGPSEAITAPKAISLTILFQYKEVWLAGLGMVGYSMAQMAQFTFWPTYMRDEFGMSLVKSGFMLGVLGVVVALGGFTIIPILSRHGGNRVPLAIIGIALTGSFLGVLATDFLPALALAFLVSGLSRGAFWTIYNTIPFDLPATGSREIAVIVAFMQTMFWMGGVLGPLLVGFVQEATGDLTLAMIVASICPIVLTVGAVGIAKRQQTTALQ